MRPGRRHSHCSIGSRSENRDAVIEAVPEVTASLRPGWHVGFVDHGLKGHDLFVSVLGQLNQAGNQLRLLTGLQSLVE